MKREVPVEKSTRLINSGNVILVTSAYEDKKNIITLAWHAPLSRQPVLVGISVAKTHFSRELIEKSGEFIINIPDSRLLDRVIYCGRNSGREVDKFKETKFTIQKAKRLADTPLIGECIGHLECAVRDRKDTGDHALFIAEVMYAEAESGIFCDCWDVNKTKLIYHLGSVFFTTSAAVIKSEA